MTEIKSYLELMLNIREFRRGILSKCDELKVTLRKRLRAFKKKQSGIQFFELNGIKLFVAWDFYPGAGKVICILTQRSWIRTFEKKSSR